MRAALCLALLALAGCGIKGPPRAPGADAPPEALERPECDECLVTEPQPGLVQEPAAPEGAPGTDANVAPVP